MAWSKMLPLAPSASDWYLHRTMPADVKTPEDEPSVAAEEARGEEAPTKNDEGAKTADASKKETRSRGSRWWYALLIILVVEFWVYGRRGEIEVCVGKQDTHDFALIGQERTDDNRWKFPRCETRENLGLRSNYELLVEDATATSCRGQTMLRFRGEGPACVGQKDGWQTQVQSHFIPPWDRRYYEHLLWFLF